MPYAGHTPHNQSDAREPCDAAEPHDVLQWFGAARGRFRFVVLHLGNYGWGHDLSPIIDYLQAHPNQRDFCFLFVGGGQKWPELSALQDGPAAACVCVAPYVARESLPSILRAVDFGLVTLESTCAGLMSPSKIHTYLAAGMALIYLGPPDSNVEEAIRTFDCGWRIDPDVPGAAEQLFGHLARREFDVRPVAARALAAFAERYCEAAGTQRIVEIVRAGGDGGQGHQPEGLAGKRRGS